MNFEKIAKLYITSGQKSETARIINFLLIIFLPNFLSYLK